MNDDSRFPVVLLWHMHQPEYRAGGHFQLPWTYLHALKDYTDMAAHLEAVPAARATANRPAYWSWTSTARQRSMHCASMSPPS